VSGKGVIESRIELGDGRAEGVAPLLVSGEAREVRWELRSGGKVISDGAVEAAWRPLAPAERLVGMTTVDSAIARVLFDRLFPDEDVKLQSIRLNPGQPLAGPAVAWDSLDAVVLDVGDRIDDEQISTLLACGTVLAVRGQSAPDSRWPWRRVEINDAAAGPSLVYWILRCELRGPRVSEISAGAFRSGLVAGWPARYRLRAMLLAVVFSILVLGAALIRGRRAAVVAIVISAASAAALAWWWRGRAPVRQRTAVVDIVRGGTVQTDDWSLRGAVGRGRDRVEFRDLLRPLFSPQSGIPRRMWLSCREDGSPLRFEYDTLPGMVTGFVWRTVGLDRPRGRAEPLEESGLRLLVGDAYWPRKAWKLRRLAPAATSEDREDLGEALIEASD